MIIASCKNNPTSTIFTVVKETEKAVQLKNEDISSKYAFPVWVPKSLIGEDVISVCGITVNRLFFKPRLWDLLDMPWKRVALGLSTY
jgi:hypothetical protein